MKLYNAIRLGLFLGIALVQSPLSVEAAGETRHRVQGEVVAINPLDSPAILVMKALTQQKEELIVGAFVEPGAKISRGTKPVSLDAIKLGETIVLDYVKKPEGVSAVAIKVR